MGSLQSKILHFLTKFLDQKFFKNFSTAQNLGEWQLIATGVCVSNRCLLLLHVKKSCAF